MHHFIQAWLFHFEYVYNTDYFSRQPTAPSKTTFTAQLLTGPVKHPIHRFFSFLMILLSRDSAFYFPLTGRPAFGDLQRGLIRETNFVRKKIGVTSTGTCFVSGSVVNDNCRFGHLNFEQIEMKTEQFRGETLKTENRNSDNPGTQKFGRKVNWSKRPSFYV